MTFVRRLSFRDYIRNQEEEEKHQEQQNLRGL